MIGEKKLASILREYSASSYESRRYSESCECSCDPRGDIENAFDRLAEMLERASDKTFKKDNPSFKDALTAGLEYYEELCRGARSTRPATRSRMWRVGLEPTTLPL